MKLRLRVKSDIGRGPQTKLFRDLMKEGVVSIEPTFPSASRALLKSMFTVEVHDSKTAKRLMEEFAPSQPSVDYLERDPVRKLVN
jgi:hypothetical protein